MRHQENYRLNSTHNRTSCRLCGSEELLLELVLPYSYIADHYASEANSFAAKYQNDIYRCNHCGHVQTLLVIDPETLFPANYTYKPSSNPALVKHFKYYASLLSTICSHRPSKCLDIGCNDGLYLSVLKEAYCCDVVGVDPAGGALERARGLGIKCYQIFFDRDTSQSIKQKEGLFDYISANNVFAHNDDLESFISAVVELLSPDGIFSFEVSYLLDIVDKTLLGTIFHEHLSHHTLTPLRLFLLRHGLHLFHSERVDTQGGALLGFASKVPVAPSETLLTLLNTESIVECTGPSYMTKFRQNYSSMIADFRNALDSLISDRNRIVIYGASRSANILIEVFQLRSIIDCILDRDSSKHGKYLHESDCIIQDDQTFTFNEGDIVIPLAWIHTDRIVESLRCKGLPLNIIRVYPTVTIVKT